MKYLELSKYFRGYKFLACSHQNPFYPFIHKETAVAFALSYFCFLFLHETELAHVSVEGLLYNFGVGVGMMFTIMSNKNDVRKLTSLLEEAETIIKGLEGELEGRCGSRSNSTSNEGDHEQRQSSISCTLKKVRSATSSLHDVGKALNEFDRVPDIGYLQLDDITALEAELEAELERMDMSLGHREKYIDGNCSGLSEVRWQW